MSWLCVLVVKGSSNLPSPVISPKPGADPQTHRACWQKKVPPGSEPHAGNILLAQAPFSGSPWCFEDCISSACFWLRAQNLLAACRGVWCYSQNPARKPLLADRSAPAGKSSNYGSENTAKAPTCSIWAATSPLPHQQPQADLPTALTSPQGDKHGAVTCHLCNFAAKIWNS